MQFSDPMACRFFYIVLYFISRVAALSTSSWIRLFSGTREYAVGSFADQNALQMIDRLEFHQVEGSSIISSNNISMSFARYECKKVTSEGLISESPIVLLHGFDSSCLEFRRLAPLLVDPAGSRPTSNNLQIYVPDILGWGFGDYSNVSDFSPCAKLEVLKCFLQKVVEQPCILVGASLGGGIAIKLATDICPELVEKLVLIDAQVGYICPRSENDTVVSVTLATRCIGFHRWSWSIKAARRRYPVRTF